ncbi:uncharacterized protein PGTG_20297, partial [Puccinia graminis f. sp. tritici CRL 75-36-700-3]
MAQFFMEAPQNPLLIGPSGGHNKRNWQTPPPQLTTLQEEVRTLPSHPSFYQVRSSLRVRQVRQKMHHHRVSAQLDQGKTLRVDSCRPHLNQPPLHVQLLRICEPIFSLIQRDTAQVVGHRKGFPRNVDHLEGKELK